MARMVMSTFGVVMVLLYLFGAPIMCSRIDKYIPRTRDLLIRMALWPVMMWTDFGYEKEKPHETWEPSCTCFYSMYPPYILLCDNCFYNVLNQKEW